MRVAKAVITAAGRKQRSLPLQTLIDRDGAEKSVLGILVEEALSAGIEEVCVVVWPGDEAAYSQAAGHPGRVRFIPQEAPLGYGHAVFCAREFTKDEPFLHMVGDHLCVSAGQQSCAARLVEAARAEACAVSSVQATRESLLPSFGAVGGARLHGRRNLYRVETVVEKPTPTEAEQRLLVPGLRAGHYLCFFGMHVLTPLVMEILARRIDAASGAAVPLSPALDELARREQYLALEETSRRYDVGARYGLLVAQLALALNGRDRDDVLAQLVELLAAREITRAADAGTV